MSRTLSIIDHDAARLRNTWTKSTAILKAEPRKINGIAIVEENRFTTFVRGSAQSDEYQLLVEWQGWFVKRGINAVIANTTSGYALYRNNLIEVTTNE